MGAEWCDLWCWVDLELLVIWGLVGVGVCIRGFCLLLCC